MSLFESTLITALRDEAEEIAMSTDLNEGREVLDSRLDDIDRGRRRRQIVLGSVAAAAAVAAVAYFAVGRPVAAPSPGDPTPAPTAAVRLWSSTPLGASSTAFVRPVSFELPPLLSSSSFIASERPTWVSIAQDLCTGSASEPCPDGRDVKLRVLAPVTIYEPGRADASPMPGFPAYVAFLESLAGPGTTMSDRRETEVDGHPAVVLTVVTSGSDSWAIACDAVDLPIDQCWGYGGAGVEPAHLRLAVIDAGATPVVMWLESNASSPEAARVDAELDRVLTTVQFDLSAANPTLGVWTRTFTRAEAASVLADLGLESSSQRVLKELEPAGDPMTFELWVDPTWYRLYAVTADGKRIKFDEHTYQRSGDTVTGTTVDGSALATVSTVAVEGTALRWTVESADTNPDPGAVSEEAMSQVLYSSSAWVRSTT